MAAEFTAFSVLEQAGIPAFFVRDGVVADCTKSCAAGICTIGMTAEALLGTAYDSFAHRQPGSTMHFPLSLGGRDWDATVLDSGDEVLFLLLPSPEAESAPLLTPAIRGLLPVLNTIRESGAALFPLLEEAENPEYQQHTASIIHAYFKTLRIISLLTSYEKQQTDEPSLRVRTELFAHLRSLFGRTADALRDSDICLEWSVPQGCLFASVDLQELTAAFLEIIANAAKHPGSTRRIHLSVTAAKGFLTLVVHNEEEMADAAMTSAFRVSPGGFHPTDPLSGLGVGLAAVQLAARRHGGIALLESSQTGGTTVTVTIRTDLPESALASPHATIPELYDPVLVGLADVLPFSTFDSRNVDL